MKTAVRCWGVAAVLQRLRLTIPLSKSGEGGNGAFIDPTVCCDAPLVSLHLAEFGIIAAASLSHPGSTKTAVALQQLLSQSVSVEWGPDYGGSFALEVSEPSGLNIFWCSDQSPALLSLLALPVEQGSASWIYFDYYPWLRSAIRATQLPKASQGYFINFGAVNSHLIGTMLEEERPWLPTGRVILQISVGSKPITAQELHDLADALQLRTLDTCILSAGAYGFAIFTSEQFIYQPAVPPQPLVDALGAGACLSASLLRQLSLGRDLFDSETTEWCAQQSSAHCQIAGNVPARLQPLWQGLVAQTEPDNNEQND